MHFLPRCRASPETDLSLTSFTGVRTKERIQERGLKIRKQYLYNTVTQFHFPFMVDTDGMQGAQQWSQ